MRPRAKRAQSVHPSCFGRAQEGGRQGSYAESAHRKRACKDVIFAATLPSRVPVRESTSSQVDLIPDAVPLSAPERLRKEQLEAIVAGGLAKFLQVGTALAELRNRRLYRTEFVTFEEYVRSKFGLHRSSVDGVIRSAQTAQVLLEAGVKLPADTTPTSLRAISALPGDELKSACWMLAQSVSPARTPGEPEARPRHGLFATTFRAPNELIWENCNARFEMRCCSRAQPRANNNPPLCPSADQVSSSSVHRNSWNRLKTACRLGLRLLWRGCIRIQ